MKINVLLILTQECMYEPFQSSKPFKSLPVFISGVDDSLSHDDRFTKETLSGLSEPFDAELFSIDEALKVGLNPLELEELQMLTNPNVIADPATEDSFRLDQL